MPGRRTTTTQPTPLEETEPTAPPPDPAPEPDTAPLEDPPAEPEPDAGPVSIFETLRRNMNPDYRAGYAAATAEFAAAQQETYPLTVHEAIAEVTRRVDAIAKTGTADARSGGYKFRGIDDVFAALHPILGDVGLVIMPGRTVEHRRETRATSGSPLNVALLRVRYTLVGPDGSRLTGEAWGEGGDTGDKGTQKAMSQAYKSFTLQTFSIPTEASAADEPDATNPASRPFTQEEQQRAATAWQAAHAATTLDALVAVRRRAAAGGLLDVPLILPADSSLVPLAVLFDRRRAELEGVTG